MLGREEEKRVLLSLLESDKSEFVAIYGRRRVGKTYLVRETFNYTFTFEHAGLANSPMKTQLKAWQSSLKSAGKKVSLPKTWIEAFDQLKELITDDDIIFLLNELGADFVQDDNKQIIFYSICHHPIDSEKHKPKLYWYKNSKSFLCYCAIIRRRKIFQLNRRIA